VIDSQPNQNLRRLTKVLTIVKRPSDVGIIVGESMLYSESEHAAVYGSLALSEDRQVSTDRTAFTNVCLLIP